MLLQHNDILCNLYRYAFFGDLQHLIFRRSVHLISCHFKQKNMFLTILEHYVNNGYNCDHEGFYGIKEFQDQAL